MMPLQLVQPAPLLILLAMDGWNTLIQDPYRRVGVLLHKQGWNVASLDLPCHGTDARASEPPELAGWAARTATGENWLDPFVARVRSVLAHLIETGIATPGRMAVAGTSRGGFLALHLAARLPGLHAVAAFAPVTDLAALREFGPLRASPLVRAMNLERFADHLASHPAWIAIGHQDDRVGTDKVVAFGDAVKRAADDQGLSSALSFHLRPTPGHRSDPEWHDQAALWFQTVMPPSRGAP